MWQIKTGPSRQEDVPTPRTTASARPSANLDYLRLLPFETTSRIAETEGHTNEATSSGLPPRTSLEAHCLSAPSPKPVVVQKPLVEHLPLQ